MEDTQITYSGATHINFTYHGMQCMLFANGFCGDAFTIRYELLAMPDEGLDDALYPDYLWEGGYYKNYDNIEQAIQMGLSDFLDILRSALGTLNQNLEWVLNVIK